MEYYRWEWLVIPLARPLPEGMILDQLISQCDGKLISQPYCGDHFIAGGKGSSGDIYAHVSTHQA